MNKLAYLTGYLEKEAARGDMLLKTLTNNLGKRVTSSNSPGFLAKKLKEVVKPSSLGGTPYISDWDVLGYLKKSVGKDSGDIPKLIDKVIPNRLNRLRNALKPKVTDSTAEAFKNL